MNYLDITYELKEAIEHDERYLLLLESERKMEASEEVMALTYQKDTKESELSDLLKIYSRDSEEVKKKMVELYKANDALTSHPLVKEYLKRYEELETLLKEVNDILFKDIRGKGCHEDCRR